MLTLWLPCAIVHLLITTVGALQISLHFDSINCVINDYVAIFKTVILETWTKLWRVLILSHYRFSEYSNKKLFLNNWASEML